MSDANIAFVGAGNMARALIAGMLDSGRAPADICASDPDPDQRAQTAALGVTCHADNNTAVAEAGIVVLAVKPQVARQVTSGIDFAPGQLLISICAGVPEQQLAEWAQPADAIVRCMPNTPALLRAGITALHAAPAVSDTQKQAAEAILGAVGTAVWVDAERDLDAVTAVSGSGPAYFFYLMEAMIRAGEQMGLSAALAEQLTTATALGAARMALETDTDPATLRVQVTSPGGTTQAALEHLEAQAVAEHVVAALKAARNRAETLSKEL